MHAESTSAMATAQPPDWTSPLLDPRVERVRLGRTRVETSRLCLGLGSSGRGHDSMQARLPLTVVAEFLLTALQHDITWWDTSDNYGSHAHVRHALAQVDRRRVQVTSKTYARTPREAEASLHAILAEIGIDYLDVLLLHEVDSVAELEDARSTLRHLARLKADGRIGAVGLSTHCIDVLERAAGDADVEVILTNYNFKGIHMDADRADYEKALEAAFDAGQGVCAMKTLGEGALASCVREALRHNLSRPWLHGVLMGVTSLDEVLASAAIWREFRANP